MGKRSASEANVDDECVMAINAMRSVSTPSSDRLMESPIPPAWRYGHGSAQAPSVEPAPGHTRVRAFPQLKLAFDEDEDMGEHDSKTRANEEEDDDDDVETDRLSALNMTFTPIIAPRPRRVVSPELIFQSATESLQRSRQRALEAEESSLSSSIPAFLELSRRRSFRPIVADRPDLEVTSPPMRAANPVIMDSRFKNMQRLDLQLDSPLQPFRPRAHRRFDVSSPASTS